MIGVIGGYNKNIESKNLNNIAETIAKSLDAKLNETSYSGKIVKLTSEEMYLFKKKISEAINRNMIGPLYKSEMLYEGKLIKKEEG